MVLVVAAAGAFVVLGDDDAGDADASDEASSQPTEDGDAPPSSQEAPSEGWTEQSSSEEAQHVLAAINHDGLTCYDTLPKPVTVNRCFVEPAIGDDQRQSVTVYSDHGDVTQVAIAIAIRHHLDRSAALYTRVVKSLNGALLSSGDVRDILATPATKREFRVAWGSASQFRSHLTGSVDLTLVARGSDEVVVPYTPTAMRSGTLRPTFSSRGLACRSQYGAESCEAEKGGIHYGVLGDDEKCARLQGGGQKCGGHVLFLQLSAGFTKATKPTFLDIVRYFDAGVRTAAGEEPAQMSRWIRDNLDGDRHIADFDGFNLEIDPGSGYSGGHPNVIALTVTGINLSD